MIKSLDIKIKAHSYARTCADDLGQDRRTAGRPVGPVRAGARSVSSRDMSHKRPTPDLNIPGSMRQTDTSKQLLTWTQVSQSVPRVHTIIMLLIHQ